MQLNPLLPILLIVMSTTSTATTTASNSNNGTKALPTSTSKKHESECEKEPLELECGRERLKRHRVEVAGRVWIPDIWGQEDLLKDWIDCSVFDASLAPKGLMSAKDALANQQHQRRSPVAATSGLEVGTASC